MKKILLLFILVICAFSCFSNVLGSEIKCEPKKTQEVAPRIDEEAAYIEKTLQKEENKADTGKQIKVIERGPGTKAIKSEYSQNFWIFILGTYLFLMIFNLSADFKKTKSIQWFWVSVFTFLAIFSWDNLDVSRSNTWFPKAVMETGIMIYLFYLYFFNKKRLDSVSD